MTLTSNYDFPPNINAFMTIVPNLMQKDIKKSILCSVEKVVEKVIISFRFMMDEDIDRNTAI